MIIPSKLNVNQMWICVLVSSPLRGIRVTMISANLVHWHIFISHNSRCSNQDPAIEHFDMAYKITKELSDQFLELQVHIGVDEIFSILQDYEKGTRFIHSTEIHLFNF